MHKYEIIIYWSNEDGAYVAEAPGASGMRRPRRYTGGGSKANQRSGDSVAGNG